MPVFEIPDTVEFQAWAARVQLQIERGDLDCLLFFGGQAVQAVGEGVRDA